MKQHLFAFNINILHQTLTQIFGYDGCRSFQCNCILRLLRCCHCEYLSDRFIFKTKHNFACFVFVQALRLLLFQIMTIRKHNEAMVGRHNETANFIESTSSAIWRTKFTTQKNSVQFLNSIFHNFNLRGTNKSFISKLLRKVQSHQTKYI